MIGEREWDFGRGEEPGGQAFISIPRRDFLQAWREGRKERRDMEKGGVWGVGVSTFLFHGERSARRGVGSDGALG